MKSFVSYIAFFWVTFTFAQSNLQGGSVLVEIVGKRIHVQEVLDLQLPDSVRQLRVRLLSFNGSSISNVSATSGEQTMTLEKQHSNGLTKIDLFSKEAIKQIELSYWVDTKESDFYIPLFFTDFPATNSDTNFFKIALRLPKTQEYALHFPNVLTNESLDGNLKEISLEVPALISTLRMEFFDGDKPSYGFASLMDGFVGFIFVIMGLIIWKNRKRLAYG